MRRRRFIDAAESQVASPLDMMMLERAYQGEDVAVSLHRLRTYIDAAERFFEQPGRPHVTRPTLAQAAPTKMVDLIMDSGAFSAWRKKEVLDVRQYIAFLQQMRPYLHEYVNLDVIPATFGVKPSAAEVERSAGEGWKNLEIMRKEGLQPMHVFHQGERRYWLEKMLGEGLEYIGISPANDRTTKQKIAWLDEVFGFLCGDKGFPTVRTHGFGVTSLPILFRYPWYTADSVSWILFGAYGQVLVPHPDELGRPDYTRSPYVLYVSNRSKELGQERRPDAVATDQSANYDALGPNMQAYVQAYFEEQGLDFEAARNTHAGRARANCRFYVNLMRTLELQPFKQHTGLFCEGTSPHGSPVNLFGNMRMVFTTTGGDDALLNEEGVRDRLISWYHIRDNNAIDIPYYVETGLVRSGPKKRKAKAAGGTPPVRPRLLVPSATVPTIARPRLRDGVGSGRPRLLPGVPLREGLSGRPRVSIGK